MYRIGDTVRVKNGYDTRPYHNWSVGTEAVVQFIRNDNLDLRISRPRRGALTNQTLYEHDVEFVSRSKYEEGDMVTVIGHSFSHDIPIGAIVKVDRIRQPNNELVIDVVDEATGHRQGVSPESLAPIAFTATQGFAGFVNASTPTNYAIAVPNNTVTVHSITDRPKCEDENLFTEFTSWMHPFIGGARDASEGLVIDACTVITFLGKTDQDDLFSIRYEDTGNIVIAKGKLNNGYAKYMAEV